MSLQGRYELLLHAYPPGYRRVRGTEILTTLMDAAPDGAARPTARDTLDLLAGGLRNRLRLRGRFHQAFAAVTALTLGCALGGIAATLTWRTVADGPARDATLAAAGLTGERFVASPTAESHPGDPLGWVDTPSWIARLLPLTSEVFGVNTTGGFGQHAVDLQRMQARMAAGGWDVRFEPPDTAGVAGSLTARRGQHILTLNPVATSYESGVVEIRALTAEIYHVRPIVVTAAGVAGGVLGGLFGWGLVAAIAGGLRPIRGRGAPALVAIEISVLLAELLYLGRVLLATSWPDLDQSGIEITYPMIDLLAVPLSSGVIVLGLALLRFLAARARPQALGFTEHQDPTTA